MMPDKLMHFPGPLFFGLNKRKIQTQEMVSAQVCLASNFRICYSLFDNRVVFTNFHTHLSEHCSDPSTHAMNNVHEMTASHKILSTSFHSTIECWKHIWLIQNKNISHFQAASRYKSNMATVSWQKKKHQLQ